MLRKAYIPGKLLTGATLFLTGAGGGGARVVAILCVVVVLVVVVGILWKGRSVVVVVVVCSFLDIKYDYDLRVDLDLANNGPLNKGQPINCTNFVC